MKAALKTARGDFEIKEVDQPRIPAPDWVLARVKVTGICGTDLRSWKVADPEREGKIEGHELSAQVVEVGENVTHVKPGDRVVVETVLGDDDCAWCNIQEYNICPNLYEVRAKTISRAFAEYVIGPERKFYRLPDDVSYEEAALLDTISVSLHAVHITGLHLHDRVAVIGAGPIGLALLQLAKAAGADVLITDLHDFNLQVAQKLGADVVANTSSQDGLEAVREFTGGRGVDITYECAGGTSMPVTLPQAVSFTRTGGKVGIVGGFESGEVALPLNWQHIQKAEIQLIPSASYSYWNIYPEMQMSLDLLAAGKLDARSMITHRFPFERINEAFETAADKENNQSIFVAIEMGTS